MRSRTPTAARVGSAVDEHDGPGGGGEGVRMAGTRVHVGRGVGELDHVLVAVLDRPREYFLGRLRPGRRFRQAGPVAGAPGTGCQRAAQ